MYGPATLLTIFVYDDLNWVPSSRRWQAEVQRNLELSWLTGCLAPDFETMAELRRDNGEAIRKVCKEFLLLCRRKTCMACWDVMVHNGSSQRQSGE